MASGRIFLVEDEALVRLDISQQLKVLGYDIVGNAASGGEALRLIEACRPDLVLMDITIAGEIDGIETAALIPAHLDVAVIFLTANGEQTTRKRASAAHPWGYLVKPIVSRELGGTIEIALQRRTILQSVRSSQDHLQFALAAAHMASWEWNPASRKVSFGAHSASVFGIADGQEAETEAAFLSRIVAADRAVAHDMFDRLLASEEGCQAEFRYRHPSTGERWLKLQGKAFPADAYSGPRVVGVAQDVTERHRTERQLREAEKKLAHLAHHDPLTGLPNRLLAMDRLDQTLERAKRRRETVAIAFIDLDHFKQVNDTLGHAAGDELLQTVARRLQSAVRSEDTVARLGGDEFLVIMERVPGASAAAAVAAKIQAGLAEPILIGDTEIAAFCTIGISQFPTDATDRDELIKAADTAMYVSKEKGRGACSFYNREMALEARLYTLETRDLRRGLEAGELRLFYMPQVSLRSGEIVGLEALIRWEHPTRGLIGAEHIVPLAERSGLIIEVGAWVIRTACEQLKAWRDQELPPLRMAVNVSARQMYSGGLLDVVCRALHQNAIPPECLEIEITESTLQNEDGCIATLSALNAVGVTLAIDDFGTGYSCLSSLKSLPIHRIKIDRAFVCDIIQNESDRAITEAILVMAHKLKMHVVAEGVETLAQERLLRDQGCDEAQGYLYGKPMSAEAIVECIRSPTRPRNPLPSHPLAGEQSAVAILV